MRTITDINEETDRQIALLNANKNSRDNFRIRGRWHELTIQNFVEKRGARSSSGKTFPRPDEIKPATVLTTEDALDGWFAIFDSPLILTNGEMDFDKLAIERQKYLALLRGNDRELAEFVLRNTNLRQMPERIRKAFRADSGNRTLERIKASEAARNRHLNSIGATR